jgi:aryl-alcohol dehydrogenase-like predicted oxidoreductase
MADGGFHRQGCSGRTRRGFLRETGHGLAAGAAAAALNGAGAAEPSKPAPGKVGYRVLGKTGLKVSEIGFGGHSWSYARVDDGHGGLRKTTPEEAMRMISAGLEMGVNLFDSCTPPEEHSVPGEVIRRLKKRDDVIVSARLCHKMKGVKADQAIIERWVDERLKLWQTDRFDILMLTNTENDTPESGYWDMSYSLETIGKLKREGKVRFAGFGCHFTAEKFMEAFAKFGRQFDICSMPYNIRHRAAEQLLPEAERLGMGIVTIKCLARGELLSGLDLARRDAGVPRDMIAFVLENPLVDATICGVHTEGHVRENFSASWTRLTPDARRRLEKLSARTAAGELDWLERGWVCV